MTRRIEDRLDVLEQHEVYIGKAPVEEIARLEMIIEAEVAVSLVVDAMSKRPSPVGQHVRNCVPVPEETTQAGYRASAEESRANAKHHLGRLKYLTGLTGEAWEARKEALVRKGIEKAQNMSPWAFR